MARLNDEFHEFAENATGKYVIKGATLARTIKNANGLFVECLVGFTVPTGATVVVKDLGGNTIAPETDGSYILNETSYVYTVSKAGHFTKTQQFEVNQADITAGTKTIEVTLVKYCVVTFITTPPATTLVVLDGEDNVIAPTTTGGKVYNLAQGTYSYTASADGYVTKEDEELVISSGDVTTGTKAVTVTLNEVQG